MGFFDIRNSADMFQKLEREYVRLQTDSSDPFNFFVTAGHIGGYLGKEVAVSEDELKEFVSQQDMVDCKALCDKAKHHTLTRQLDKRSDPKTRTWRGGICGAPIGVLGVAAGAKRVMLSGNRTVDVDWLAERVMQKWRGFFSAHKLL
ncbi:hypothetical protein GCM10027399_16890 [Curvibacter fontanus]